MDREGRRRERSIALFLFGILALNYPVASLFSGGQVFGLPLLFVYLFFVWLLGIVLAAIALGGRDGGGTPGGTPPGSET